MTSLWRRHRWWLTPTLLILPGAILFAVVILASSVQSLWISLHDWDGFGPMVWIGLGNYRELMDDPQFYVSLKNNIIWLVMFMLAPPIGLAIALLVNQKIKGMRVVKSSSSYRWCSPRWPSAWSLPGSTLRSSDYWRSLPRIRGERSGAAVGRTLRHFCHRRRRPLAADRLLHGSLPRRAQQPERGADRCRPRRRRARVEHVAPHRAAATDASHLYRIAVTVVGALRSFDMISVMTRGGPFGSSSVLAYQMFEQSIFSYRFGYGAAIASVLFVIMAVFIIWYLTRIIRAEERGA